MTKISIEDTLPILLGCEDHLFTIYDYARKAYTAPFLASTLEQAKRFCVDQIKTSPTSYFALYPNSFSLCHIGVFDHSAGKVKDSGRVDIGTFAQIQRDVEDSAKNA